jgi:hypothetical protein
MYSRNVEQIARAFHAASLAIGIPSGLAFLVLGVETIRLQLGTPANPGQGKSGNQMIDLFVAGFSVFGKLLNLFSGVAKWLIALLTAVAFVALVFAATLFFTARGLNAGRTWARVFGVALAVAPLLLSVGTLLSTRRTLPFTLAGMTAAASAYTIYTLCWRFQ